MKVGEDGERFVLSSVPDVALSFACRVSRPSLPIVGASQLRVGGSRRELKRSLSAFPFSGALEPAECLVDAGSPAPSSSQASAQ